MAIRDVRSFDYVNKPYDQVSQALADHAVEVFHAATQAAASRGHTVAAELKFDLSGIAITAEVDVAVWGIERIEGELNRSPQTNIKLEWQASNRPNLFPFMNAELAVYPLTRSETQLDFNGRYEPPLGRLGGALDAVAGRLVAEACVHRFVGEVARYLRTELD
jgi:hypothetical protein